MEAPQPSDHKEHTTTINSLLLAQISELPSPENQLERQNKMREIAKDILVKVNAPVRLVGSDYQEEKFRQMAEQGIGTFDQEQPGRFSLLVQPQNLPDITDPFWETRIEYSNNRYNTSAATIGLGGPAGDLTYMYNRTQKEEKVNQYHFDKDRKLPVDPNRLYKLEDGRQVILYVERNETNATGKLIDIDTLEVVETIQGTVNYTSSSDDVTGRRDDLSPDPSYHSDYTVTYDMRVPDGLGLEMTSLAESFPTECPDRPEFALAHEALRLWQESLRNQYGGRSGAFSNARSILEAATEAGSPSGKLQLKDIRQVVEEQIEHNRMVKRVRVLHERKLKGDPSTDYYDTYDIQEQIEAWQESVEDPNKQFSYTYYHEKPRRISLDELPKNPVLVLEESDDPETTSKALVFGADKKPIHYEIVPDQTDNIMRLYCTVPGDDGKNVTVQLRTPINPEHQAQQLDPIPDVYNQLKQYCTNSDEESMLEQMIRTGFVESQKSKRGTKLYQKTVLTVLGHVIARWNKVLGRWEPDTKSIDGMTETRRNYTEEFVRSAKRQGIRVLENNDIVNPQLPKHRNLFAELQKRKKEAEQQQAHLQAETTHAEQSKPKGFGTAPQDILDVPFSGNNKYTGTKWLTQRLHDGTLPQVLIFLKDNPDTGKMNDVMKAVKDVSNSPPENQSSLYMTLRAQIDIYQTVMNLGLDSDPSGVMQHADLQQAFITSCTNSIFQLRDENKRKYPEPDTINRLISERMQQWTSRVKDINLLIDTTPDEDYDIGGISDEHIERVREQIRAQLYDTCVIHEEPVPNTLDKHIESQAMILT